MKGNQAADMVKLGLILALYAAAACIMLAFVYTGTEKIIAVRQMADRNAALKELFPQADEFRPVEIASPDPQVFVDRDKSDPGDTGAYEALQNGATLGAVMRLTRASYGGPIKLMAGVSVRGTITGVKILEHQDTPGLGANAASPSYFVDRVKRLTFYGQFAGKSVNDPFAVKDDVAAITASTITSQAVSAAVKAAGTAVSAWLDGKGLETISAASADAAGAGGAQ